MPILGLRQKSWRWKRFIDLAVVYMLAVALATISTYHGRKAYEVHLGLGELRNFERLVNVSIELGAAASSPAPAPILILQHIHKRGPIEAASQRSHAAYARAWGYRYRQDTNNYVHRGNKCYNKLYTLRSAMEDELASDKPAQWILYCDADQLISDPSVPVHDLLPPSALDPAPLLLGNEDHNGFNSGLLLMRVDITMRFFLDDLIRQMEAGQDNKWTDQMGIYNLLRAEPRYAQHFYRIPKHWLNAYWLDETGDPWVPQLHVHFVNRLKHEIPFRPVLEHASAVMQRALHLWNVESESERESESGGKESGERALRSKDLSSPESAAAHPLARLALQRPSKFHADYWASSAVSGISGMRFLDETSLTVVKVP